MTDLIWAFIFSQMAMGLFDSLYHHELTQRLAWRPSQRGELGLHGVRNLAYAVIFGALGWSEPHGAWAIVLIALIAAEVVITLWDFVEEDRSRRLPHTERVLHGILTANYGAVLVLLAPLLIDWAAQPTALRPAFYWPWSWFCAIAVVGTIASGLRELAAARRASRIVPDAAAPLAAALTSRQSVLVTGGTGFVGSRLVETLVTAGHDVTVLTRDRGHAAHLKAPLRMVTSLDQLASDTRLDAIVNLAGEPISDGLWTIAKRRKIIDSRIAVTRAVLALIKRLATPPDVLISGSAIGWYGLREDEALDEMSAGTDCFSREVCVAWEREAIAATKLGVRVVSLRTGLVLGAEGGMLSRLLVPFDLGVGGRMGRGRHWMSWIHRDDLVRLIVHAIATPTLAGPINATAPGPVRNADFTAALGRALSRPAVLPVPALPLRLALGAFADELLLGGQKVLPRAALGSGFDFDYPTIDMALGAIVGNQSAASLSRKWSTPSLRSPLR
jgi:uncharacterized protein (TIGR01777 family)